MIYNIFKILKITLSSASIKNINLQWFYTILIYCLSEMNKTGNNMSPNNMKESLNLIMKKLSQRLCTGLSIELQKIFVFCLSLLNENTDGFQLTQNEISNVFDILLESIPYEPNYNSKDNIYSNIYKLLKDFNLYQKNNYYIYSPNCLYLEKLGGLKFTSDNY